MLVVVAEEMRPHRLAMTIYAGFVALSAYFGAIGMISGRLRVEASMAARLPFHSPVFGGLALACVVAAPTTVVAVLAWRRHPRTRDAATVAGLLLVGWIAVEMAITREFSALQPVYAVAGLGLIFPGDRRILNQVAQVTAALPLFATAPLWRRWHLRWGATPGEVADPMPGDHLVPVSHFTATRAISIDAPPDEVWPWLLQVGYRRAGFYSYDLLDNLGRPSTETILPEWQHLDVGDIAAPMANPPTSDTSFVIVEAERPTRLVWAKPDSTWSWTLRALPDGRTRLVTRLKQRYRRRPGTLLTVILAEFGDFPMMRRMLLGIRRRAEAAAAATRRPGGPADTAAVDPAAGPYLTSSTRSTPAPRPARSSLDLYWLPLGAGGHSVRFNGRVYEALAALHERRPARHLYHSALEVHHEDSRYVIEMAPVWNEAAPERGVVREGPVGAGWLGRSRWFRYEVRCWRDGHIPDVAEAVQSPQRMSDDPLQVANVLDLLRDVPCLTWGRDELGTGEMWNSNSLVSWLLARAGHDMTAIQPPEGGRAPGWLAGLALASRHQPPSGRPRTPDAATARP